MIFFDSFRYKNFLKCTENKPLKIPPPIMLNNVRRFIYIVHIVNTGYPLSPLCFMVVMKNQDKMMKGVYIPKSPYIPPLRR